MLILPRYRALQAQIGHWRVNSVVNLISRLFQVKMVDFKIQTSNTSLFFKTILISNKKILSLLTLKWHIFTDDHSYTMLFEETF